MDNNEEKIWYNIKEENGTIKIEKTSNSKKDEKNIEPNEKKIIDEVIPYQESKHKKRNTLITILAIFFLVFSITIILVLLSNNYDKAPKRYRTFMIYMVGSDLETNGKMGTFDLNDLTNANIDLNDNNVILIVGGSKKWHNFVKENEVGIYELTNTGFKKKKTLSSKNMGTSTMLVDFLNYSYNNYPAEKYNMVFWNHGLGAVGLESDEISEDYLSIKELDSAFKNSPFNDVKLETVIFNNCLSGNIHFANIMSNYSEYMVASEEVMYVGALIDRLNFIEDVKKEDTGYDIGLHYIDRTDESIKKLNSNSYKNYDSTLSIIDLSKINSLNQKVNKFFDSLNINADYSSIARARKRTYTYSASTGYSYDTVDLYELVEELEPYSSDYNSSKELKSEIKEAVKYNSALNYHSNGLSIYFPYYGNSEYVETHLLFFKSLWNNSYTKFIEDFYDNNTSSRRAKRASSGNNINKLTNEVIINNNQVSLELTEEEKNNYQGANIYIFSKNDESYSLLLKSNDFSLDDNKLLFNYFGLLNMGDNRISLIYDDNYKVYGSIDSVDVIENLKIEDTDIEVVDAILDSKDSPANGIIDIEKESELAFYKLNYILEENGEIKEDWKENVEKEKIEYNKEETLQMKVEDLNDYYILIEMYDIDNDVYYSNIIK